MPGSRLGPDRITVVIGCVIQRHLADTSEPGIGHGVGRRSHQIINAFLRKLGCDLLAAGIRQDRHGPPRGWRQVTAAPRLERAGEWRITMRSRQLIRLIARQHRPGRGDNRRTVRNDRFDQLVNRRIGEQTLIVAFGGQNEGSIEMPNGGRADRHVIFADDPQLGRDVTDMIVLERGRVLDLRHMPAVIDREHQIDTRQNTVMCKGALEDRPVPAGCHQFSRACKSGNHAGAAIDHHAIGILGASQVAHAMAVSEGGTQLLTFLGQLGSMHRKPETLRALLEQGDPRLRQARLPAHSLSPVNAAMASAITSRS